MRLSRVHVAGPLACGRRQSLTGSAANHVTRVLRLRAGDGLTLFDGQGGEYAASIDEVRKDAVWVNIAEHRAIERESPLQLTLAQGISRGERMDWVVQKSTELGVTRIAPVFTERSVVHLDAGQAQKKVQHWHAIAVAACEQSGRNRVPQIDTPLTLYEFLEHRATGGLSLLLSPHAKRRIAALPPPEGAVTVLIGPEGGLTDLEQETAIARGFTSIRLGPRVLRTETAAVCALTLLQQKAGDL